MARDVSAEEVDAFYDRLRIDAEASGYHLNPDEEFTKDLARSLIVNRERYGYPSCPCRLAAGSKEEDLDIICPCDYRDPDIGDYGACYCALYVSAAVLKGEERLTSVPERRPGPDDRAQKKAGPIRTSSVSSRYPVWRCRVCGYLCARGEPPEVCPICKAGRERFEQFAFSPPDGLHHS